MGIMQLTEDTEVGMYVFVFLVGAGFTSIPLVACWAVFGRGHLKWRMFAFTMIVLLIVSALSFTAYCQTGSRATALSTGSCGAPLKQPSRLYVSGRSKGSDIGLLAV